MHFNSNREEVDAQMPKAVIAASVEIPVATELSERAKREGRTMSSIVSEALDHYLKEHQAESRKHAGRKKAKAGAKCAVAP